jgi:hypothetical protein
MKQTYVYVVQTKQGIPYADIMLSRAEARAAKAMYEARDQEKLQIARYKAEKVIR